LRAGPGKNYELIGEVEEGTDVGIMAECDGWYYVSSYGMNGWMDGEFLPRH
jgi:SH3 domain protein